MVQAFVPPPADMPEFEYLRKGLSDDDAFSEQMQPTFFKYKVMRIDADGNKVECTDENLSSIEKTHKDSAEWVKLPNKRSWVRHCLDLIDRLKKHRNEFAWFSQPVDWKKMGLNDYPKIVQKPMDFSTLEGKLKSGQISDPEEFIVWARVIFRNCFLFNPENTIVAKCGEKLSIVFEEELSKLRNQLK